MFWFGYDVPDYHLPRHQLHCGRQELSGTFSSVLQGSFYFAKWLAVSEFMCIECYV